MAEAPEPKVSIVVLNWDGREFLDKCLRSLVGLDYPADGLELILCDNGSQDGSAEYVREHYPRFRVVALDRNHGFAEGNNLAAAEATGEWVGFVNNDVEVPRDWLRHMVAPLGARPDVACVASRILNADGSAIDFIGGGVNFQGHGLQLDHDAPSSPHDVERAVLFACGGAMLVRRQLFLSLGGFDPAYFAFFEDVDLGWRLNLLGHDVWYTPAATVLHRHHGTASRLPSHQLRVLSERNALYTIYKNYDDQHLSKVLPVALILLNEKALLMANVDSDRFRLADAPPPPEAPPHHAPPGRPGPIVRLRQRGASAAFRAVVRRLRRAASALIAAPQPVIDGGATSPSPGMPDLALSQLVTISEFGHNLERLRSQREWVQSRRRRTDAEVLALCGLLLEDPTFGHSGYLDFQHWICRVAGIDASFSTVGF